MPYGQLCLWVERGPIAFEPRDGGEWCSESGTRDGGSTPFGAPSKTNAYASPAAVEGEEPCICEGRGPREGEPGRHSPDDLPLPSSSSSSL